MWLAVTPDELPPSPKVQEYEVIEPSESDEPDPLKLTAKGTCPDVRVAVKLAEGGVPIAAVTVIVHESESEFPSVSLPVSSAVYVPGYR